jgi:short-chain fatty acids transporter
MMSLSRLAARTTALSERWLPDAFIFALGATALAVVGGLTLGGAGLDQIVVFWGKGFWTLIPFTMQMALIVITGTVAATAAPIRRAVGALAGIPKSNRSAVVFVALFAMATSWINWGFGLVFAAVLARAIARRLPGVDYRTLAACTLLGLGSIWAQGLSGSATLQMATPGMLPAPIRDVVARGGGAETLVPDGIIPLQETVFLWQSLLSVLIEIAVVGAVVYFIAPTGDRVRTAAQLGVRLDEPSANLSPEQGPRSPGEWLEHQPWVNWLVVALAAGYLWISLSRAPSLTAAITLDTLNLFFLALGFALHGTPARLMRAFKDATPATWGLLLQFPFYAGIAAIITETGLSARIASVFTSIANPLSYPAVIALYSAALGLFVPSGGSKWVIEAPYVIQAAHQLKVHLGWAVASYNLGEALANLIQPFWMLPVLGLLGLRARDIMGITFAVFLVLTPLVLVLVTVLGATLRYPL